MTVDIFVDSVENVALFDEMVEAGATRLGLNLGWAFPHETHREMARTVLLASNVPHLLDRMRGLEDGARRTRDALTWALTQVEGSAEFDPATLPEFPELPDAEPDDES